MAPSPVTKGDISIEGIESAEPTPDTGFPPFPASLDLQKNQRWTDYYGDNFQVRLDDPSPEPRAETHPYMVAQPTLDLKLSDDEFEERYGIKKRQLGKVQPLRGKTGRIYLRSTDWPFRTEDEVIRARILWMIH